MFNEGLDNTSAAEGVWSHHQHLILLHSVQKRFHMGSDCLCNKGEEDLVGKSVHYVLSIYAHIFHFLTFTRGKIFVSYTLTFLGRREPLCGTFLYSIWCFAFSALA